MENKATTKTPIPPHRASLVWILSPVSCLLPYPPRLALYTCRASSTNPPLFCKTNPILTATKPTQPSLPQRVTKENHHCPLEENKPNRTQTNPIKPNPSPKLELCSTLSEACPEHRRRIEGPINPNSPRPQTSQSSIIRLLPSLCTMVRSYTHKALSERHGATAESSRASARISCLSL